ncbi:hypothetical protein VOLCADRAFT_108177 [Volvox carteri f. nagariensis]|uniref:Uncharacterized protein n=1 Tax=Volvox carteri f. nagariensis TaxID=3068 RepID=D8UIS3_VOLCA|nr:uncharacterized protein VOLCADRAFT_108177 [Volvox carteri f. nagariensis]EFJ40387.1 hypothetical protein VOLCADRAFT_108177 [Volvox carteri f. nagariensis]|eukprot:XP_002958538.1 hypothetical protein VOLCADRAFT_108177 [Volvox carteri f. nagariensis]
MELAFTGGFAWATWQVLGRLQKHVSKIEKNIDDGRLLGDWNRECKAQVANKQRASAAMGQGAAASSHDHIFEEWRNKKLKPAQITQLATDLAELAQWAGAGSWVPELRTDEPVRPWTEYGSAGKVHLLQAADALEFNFADVVKQQAEDLARNWLWQVTEALPALSAEPVRSAGPSERLGDLKTRLAAAEVAVRAAFDAERRTQAGGLKLLVQPLAVAACLRKIQMLKVLLEDVGLTGAASAAAAERIRTELKAPLTLSAADSTVAAQKDAAAAAVAAEADAAVAAERATRMAEIDDATAATYRRVLTLQAASPSHWHASSSTPALHRLGLLAALMAEMACCDAAGTKSGAAAAAALVDAIRKLTPQMRVKLSEEEKSKETELLAALTPAPPAAEAVAEAADVSKEDGEVEAHSEADGEAEAAEPSSPPSPPPARPSPGAAAVQLRELLEGAIRAELAQRRAERKAARAAARQAAKAEAKAAAAAAAAAAEAEAKAAAEQPAGELPEASAPAEAAADPAEAAGRPEAAEQGAADEEKEEEGKEEADEGEAVKEQEEAEEGGKGEGAAEGAEEKVEKQEEEEAVAAQAESGTPAPVSEEMGGAVVEAAAEEENGNEEEEEEEEEALTPDEAVDVEAVRRGVEAEARARADAEKEGAVLKLQDALDGLRASTVVQAMKTLVGKVTAAAADDAPDAGTRLLAIEYLFRDAAAAPTGVALAGAVADAVAKLTAADRTALDAASAAAVLRLETAAARVKLTADTAKLDMGPGCSEVLRRTDAWLAEQQEAVVAAAERAAARAAKAEAAKAAAEAAAAAKAEAAAESEATADLETPAPADGAAEEGEAAEAAEAETKAAEGEVAEADPEQTQVAPEEGKQAEEEEEEAGPAGNPVRLAEGRTLVSELLAEGLVLLELPAPSNKKLQLTNKPDVAVQEVVGQLGPIGGSVDARVGQVAEEADREKLLQVRANAMSIYSALTAFLRLETETWESAKSDVEQAKKAVFGIKIERRAESLAAAMEACGGVSERCAALARAVLGLSTAEGRTAAVEAKAALQGTAELAQALSAALNDYISYVRLREHALGIPITAKAELDEECELSLPTLDEMTSRHGEDAVWLDLAGLGLPPVPAEDEEEAEEEGGEEARREAEAAHERAVEELQQRLNDWHTTGLRLLARGQAALVTLGGKLQSSQSPRTPFGLSVDGSSGDGGELRLTADLGLPSAKSLVQLGAEKVARLQLLAAESVSGPNSGVAYPLHWYLLVPPASVGHLKAFFEEKDFFGLLPSQVHVYGNLVRPPLMNEEFKVVLDSSGCRTARSQPGSGEVFLALRRCGALSHMRRVGIRCLEVDCVEDNLLGRPLDPAFLGACAATAIDSAAKVAVPGVQTEGPSALPELYSRYLELLGGSSPLLATLGDAVPALGSYYFSMDFVRRVDKLLRDQPLALYRLAPADKVPTRGTAAAAAAKSGGGAAAAPAAPGGGAAGYRLDRRLSDFASPAIGRLLGGRVHLAMVAVDAGTEFAPVWGTAPFYRTASPRAAVDALLLQQTRWVEDSGGALADEEEGVVEVSPLVSYAGEGLGPLVEGKTFEEAYVHELQGFAAESTGSASNVGIWAVPALVLYGGVTAAKLLSKVCGLPVGGLPAVPG